MEDEDLIPLSALQHYLYCPRQWGLIHLEQMWTENVFTAKGRLLHKRTDKPGSEVRHGVRTVTAMPLRSKRFGISGVADVVEFHDRDGGSADVVPVEYKRGRPKSHRADEVQLCAQALCLEEMFGVSVGKGLLFYGETRRRQDVSIDEGLRQLTEETISAIRASMKAGKTPLAEYNARKCKACSLLDDCQPVLMSRAASVADWIEKSIASEPS